MDCVLDKEQRLSEGHSEAEDRKMGLEDLTDDDEVALNLPRKGVEERDPPGEEIPRLPRGHRFGGTGDSAGGMVSDRASAWGSTKMESSGTTNIGDGGAPGSEATGGIYGLEAG